MACSATLEHTAVFGISCCLHAILHVGKFFGLNRLRITASRTCIAVGHAPVTEQGSMAAGLHEGVYWTS